jgi:HAE1 family hydrophobic/amphiphilic exporter-1
VKNYAVSQTLYIFLLCLVFVYFLLQCRKLYASFCRIIVFTSRIGRAYIFRLLMLSDNIYLQIALSMLGLLAKMPF